MYRVFIEKLPDWKVNKFFWKRYSLKVQISEKRVSVATLLEQYTCRCSCVVRHIPIHHKVQAALPRLQGGPTILILKW